MPSFQDICEAIQEASDLGLATEPNEILTGYSGEQLTGTLQRLSQLCLTDDTCYLEVGVYQGLTLLSVASAVPERSVYGIDNFAFFDAEGKNFGIVKERREKLGATNAEVINLDYEDALADLSAHLGGKKVGVYFVDGPHDYRSQLVCLLLIKPFLAPGAVIIVDDCNYRHVRQANNDFLMSHPEFKLIFQAYTSSHPKNMNPGAYQQATMGWWNGANVIVHDPDNELEPFLPPTYRSRKLYENEHEVHASKFPGLVPAVLPALINQGPTLATQLNLPADQIGRFPAMNTFSEDLTRHQFHPAFSEF